MVESGGRGTKPIILPSKVCYMRFPNALEMFRVIAGRRGVCLRVSVFLCVRVIISPAIVIVVGAGLRTRVLDGV